MALPFVAGILSKWTPDSKEAVCPDKGTPGRSQGSPAEIVSIFLMFNRLSWALCIRLNTNQQDGDGHCVKNANAAVDELELQVLVQVEDDAGDDPEDVEDVEDCDGDQDGCQEATEVAVLPVLDDHNEEEEVEDERKERKDGPSSPPPIALWFNHLKKKVLSNHLWH